MWTHVVACLPGALVRLVIVLHEDEKAARAAPSRKRACVSTRLRSQHAPQHGAATHFSNMPMSGERSASMSLAGTLCTLRSRTTNDPSTALNSRYLTCHVAGVPGVSASCAHAGACKRETAAAQAQVQRRAHRKAPVCVLRCAACRTTSVWMSICTILPLAMMNLGTCGAQRASAQRSAASANANTQAQTQNAPRQRCTRWGARARLAPPLPGGTSPRAAFGRASGRGAPGA